MTFQPDIAINNQIIKLHEIIRDAPGMVENTATCMKIDEVIEKLEEVAEWFKGSYHYNVGLSSPEDIIGQIYGSFNPKSGYFLNEDGEYVPKP